MIGLLCFALAVLASPFKSKLRHEAENAVLRHQLIVLRRKQHGRVRLTNHDRWLLIQLYLGFLRSCRCACRKSNTHLLVMQSAEDWAAKNTPCPLDSTR
jgi:hypothetical protein